MTEQESIPKRIAVIGGGISGLAAAHRLRELAPQIEVHLYEAKGHLGGVLETIEKDGYQIELGSDSFITNKPEALKLCKRLSFEEELIQTRDEHRQTFLVHRGKLKPVPEGFMLMTPTQWRSIATTPILSPWGKLRLAGEWFVPKRKASDEESIAQFVRRRLGRETYERLVQPLVGGIYTGDAEQLSLEATMPRFVEMERQHGGLISATWKNRAERKIAKQNSGARYSLFVTPRRGLSSFIQRLAESLPPEQIHCSSPIQNLQFVDQMWEVETSAGMRRFDSLILALPTSAASKIVNAFDQELASAMAEIPYAGAAIVSLGFAREQIAHPLNGFGFVVPEIEGRDLLACSFSSIKFAGRAPEGKVLLRAFIGGAKRPELVHASEEELFQKVLFDLRELLGISGEPELKIVSRYPEKMPQYHVGHQARIEKIETLAKKWKGLALAGNAYHGVGIPDCILSGERAAEQILK
ncbi:Protoporphyrinogen oxidase [Planctomycetales bacterium 10988]|nr:Protoporphyrinogen oxidase [Planctomycetales bacterium 10988]